MSPVSSLTTRFNGDNRRLNVDVTSAANAYNTVLQNVMIIITSNNNRERRGEEYLHWSNIDYLKLVFMQNSIPEVLFNL